MSFTVNHEQHKASIQHGTSNANDTTPDPVNRKLSDSLANSPGGFITTVEEGVKRNTSLHVDQGIRQDGHPGDALKTARTKHGAPVQGAVGPDDVIEIAGVTMTVKAAQRAGIIGVDAQGNYADVEPQAPTMQTKTNRPDVLSPSTRQAVEIIGNHVGPDQVASLIARAAIQSAKGGGQEGIKGYLSDMASLTGFTPKQSIEFGNAVFNDIAAHLVNEVGQTEGMDSEQTMEALEWMMTDNNIPSSHVAAIFNGTLYGDTSAFQAAVKRYNMRNSRANRQSRGLDL